MARSRGHFPSLKSRQSPLFTAKDPFLATFRVERVEPLAAALSGPGDPETRAQRLVRRLRNTATSQDVEGMSTDEIMRLLRGEPAD
jgi:hypothetical protein